MSKELQRPWIFLAEGKNAFSKGNPALLIEKTQQQQEQGMAIALYYDPLIHTDTDFLDAFDAAFPLVNPSIQLPEETLLLEENSDFNFPDPIMIEEPSPSHFPKVTVITRVRNGGKILSQTLKSLRSQTVKNIELHVIDSGSKDNSIDIADHYGALTRSISADAYFPGKVLNEAMRHTTTEFVVFLNSDSVLLTPTSLKNLLEQFQDPLVTAAYGRQLPRPDAEIWVKRDYEVSFPSEPTPPPWMVMSLCLAAVRRLSWEKHPFYTEAWGSEDTQWGVEAKKREEKIGYTPEALVMHSHNYTLVQLYGRRFIEGEADAFIFERNHTFFSFVREWIKGTARDLILYIKKNAWMSILQIPFRRFVFSWAYLKGFQLGKKRRENHIQDASKGQQEVLKRYDDRTS